MVLWTIILGALFSGHPLLSDYVFLIIMMVLAGAGLAEFYGLAGEARPAVLPCVCGILGGVLLMVGTFYNLTGKIGQAGLPARVNDFETSFLDPLCARALRPAVCRPQQHRWHRHDCHHLVRPHNVPWLLNFIQKINFFPHVEGHFYLLYFGADHEIQRHGRLLSSIACSSAVTR